MRDDGHLVGSNPKLPFYFHTYPSCRVECRGAMPGPILAIGFLQQSSKAEAREAWGDVFKTNFFQGKQESDQAGKAPYTPSKTEPDRRISVRGPGTSA